MTDKIVEELTRRVEFLENRLMNHMVFKSSSPTSASDCLDTIAKALWSITLCNIQSKERGAS